MKKFIIVLLAVALIGLPGCEEWLDVNKNPNDATSSTPELIVPGVLTNWASDVMGLTTTSGALMGYWSHMGGWSGFYDVKKYEITTGFYNAFGYYTGQLNDCEFIRKNSGINVVYPAITDVVDSWYYSRLIDVYNDVPYSEACNPDLTLTPAYDDAETIWLDLIDRLDNAIVVFDSAANAVDHATNAIYSFKTAADVIFGGDFNKWAVFANTLKLRLVMRLTAVKSVGDLTALMSNTDDEYGFVSTNVTANPGYAASSGKTQPWWNSFGKTYDGTNVNANTQYGLNAYFHRKLQLLNDPRLTQNFFAPSAAPGGALISMQYGTDGDLTVQPNVTVLANYSWLYIASNWAVVGKVNTGNGATNPQLMFSAAESYFLQAEAAQRGIIATTTPDAAYTAGITASCNLSKVLAADRDAYLASSQVLWSASWTDAEKIERIINQKYIANYFINMWESYCDYRRTGFPNPKRPGYVADPTNDVNYEMLSYYPSGIVKRQIPRIIPYPQAEIDVNKVKVQEAIDKQIAAHGVQFNSNSYPFNARVFWDAVPEGDIDYNY